jgi:hypothetical protein
MDSSRRHWTVFFFLAAAFNFCMGLLRRPAAGS